MNSSERVSRQNSTSHESQPLLPANTNDKKSKTSGSTGPNLIQKIYSVASTVLQLIIGWSFDDVQGNYGKKIEKAHLITLMGKFLEGKNHFNFIPNYLTGSIVQSDAADINRRIKEPILEGNKKPIFIPLVINNHRLFEPIHIVALVIDPSTKKVEYFDSKGVAAEDKWIDENHTVKDFIDVVIKDVDDGEKAVGDYEFVQNKIVHQLDIHNCGAYVAYYAQRRFKENQSSMPTDICRCKITQIREDMRKEMRKIGFPGY